jgi:hypothetical protein
MSRMGRNPFGKSETRKSSPLLDLRDEVLAEELGLRFAKPIEAEGLVNWATVDLPARLYLTALKTWMLVI